MTDDATAVTSYQITEHVEKMILDKVIHQTVLRGEGADRLLWTPSIRIRVESIFIPTDQDTAP